MYVRLSKLLLPLLVLFLLPTVLASQHYSYEHAEEMRISGRIDWRDYGPEAFQEAITENKPIFLMLTAPSWCYWCHVYTSDDYIYNPAVYPTINENFIPIYVDADKRQDLTRQYLEGGWPSTTVFTPGRERIFGYSGPRPIANMLVNLNEAVEYVRTHGSSNKALYDYKKTSPKLPSSFQLNNLISGYAAYTQQTYDSSHGGFGTGQKFPQGRTLDFSLELYEATGDKKWLSLVQNTLQNQYTNIQEITTNYNLFDPVEGGFHRYGTQRDWTPPHYEKMLYDNARLLKAYVHLLQLNPDDPLAREVVEKTINYIAENWWDPNGGFYGNSDVHGEEHYYGKVLRPSPKARVEKTKYSDWNSDAIVTFLYIWQVTQEEVYKQMAERSLDFFSQEMVTDQGAYHFKKIDGSKGVRGSLLDNAYVLLAFVEGFEVLGKQEYLKTAQKLANYSLENLYDWNSGGFFERNSPDLELYAPGENIRLSKPNEENGIMSYALLKLYKQTNNSLYLNAALKTIGGQVDDVAGLDRGYYYVKAAQFILTNNLLSVDLQVEQIEKEKQQNFWLNDITTGFVVSEQGLDKLQGPFLVLILIALIAGFISFASPCTLPILPAYIAYMFKSSKKNIKSMTFAFFLGLSVVFSLLGMSATALGNFLKSNLTFFSQIAGVGIMLFGLYILIGKGFKGFQVPTTYMGSFLFGAALAISWTPCVGPILVAVLLMASTASSAYTGGILLFVYGLGLALPLVFVSMYLEKINEKSKLWRIIKGKELKFKIFNKKIAIHTNTLVSGVLFLILGFLIFSGILYSFNQYVTATSFQKWIFGLEEWLLNMVK